MFELDMLSYMMGKKAGGGGGETVEQVEQTVEPDFSGGDMVVLPDAGKAFSKVTVEQPENLIAENIAEGVNIAGIVGALAAGGSGAVFEYIEFPCESVNASGATVIPHNLGVVPDVVIAYAVSGFTGKVSGAAGVSSKMVERYGIGCGQFISYKKADGTQTHAYASVPGGEIDATNANLRGIHEANAETISIGRSDTPMYNVSGKVWYIMLIGGLT